MKFRSILHTLMQMTDEELERDARIFIPTYMRSFRVQAFAPERDEPVSEANPMFFISARDAQT